MYLFIPRYIITLLIGVLIGVLIPDNGFFLGVGIALAIILTLLATEFVGMSGFGNHWREYRFFIHLLYTVPIIIGCVGVLLGSGYIGKMFIWIGTLLS